MALSLQVYEYSYSAKCGASYANCTILQPCCAGISQKTSYDRALKFYSHRLYQYI